MAGKDKLPAKIQEAIDQIGVEVEKVGSPVTRGQVDDLGKLHDLRERGKHQRTIVNVWKQQQDQDRQMRKLYATWLMVAISVQVVAINVILILLGCGVLKLEQWTANTFVMAAFAEISALVLLVVKYLFPATSDKVLELIDRFRVKDQK
jgi:hypothetical protein